jgi:hypothetical protein
LPPDFWVTRNVTADVLDPNSLRVSIDYDWDLLAGWNEPLHYCTHDMLESWEGFRTQIFLLRYAVENYQINTVILVKCLLSPSPTLVFFFLTSLGRRLRWQRTCCSCLTHNYSWRFFGLEHKSETFVVSLRGTKAASSSTVRKSLSSPQNKMDTLK